MALAALVASEKEIHSHELMEVVLEASGTDQLIRCQVKKVKHEYFCQLAMPVPEKIEQKTVLYEGDELNLVIVSYDDFFHIVIEVDDFNDALRKKAQTLAKLLGAISEANLIGILLFNTTTDEMAPLIYVPSIGSMIWERGCGSGTASLGAYLSWKNKGAIAVPIKQPGGMIHVTAECYNEEVTCLKIEGSVGIVAQGKAFIDD
jgi:diaminopimelate epimerase